MTPKKQVSPVIRISREKRDASARATHLEAATRKFLVTTNERKQMSTKTNFKRIALVAVAALGLGVLSSVPSQAAISGLTVTATDGTSSFAVSDSTTAANLNITGLMEIGDSITVQVVTKSVPVGTVPAVVMMNLDSGTPTMAGSTVSIETVVASGSGTIAAGGTLVVSGNVSAGTPMDTVTSSNLIRIVRATSTGITNQNIGFQLDTNTARVAGTYTYTVLVKAFDKGSTKQTITNSQPDTTIIKDISIVVAAAASASTTPTATYSYVDLSSNTGAGNSAGRSDTTDDVISIVATAGTAAGSIFVGNRNAANASGVAKESITATVVGAGLVCTGTLASATAGTCGKSVKVAATGDYQFLLQADGSAGLSTITVTSTVSGVTAVKTLNYFSKAAKTLTASVFTPILAIGTNDSAVAVSAVDSAGVAWAGSAYIYASAAADATAVGGSATTPVACTYRAANATHYCPITATAAGTGKFKVIDAATVALATATSNEVSVTSKTAVPATVKISFNKATYAPGEVGSIVITPLDADGKTLPATAITSGLASGGITSNLDLTYNGGAVTLTGTTITTSAYSGSTTSAGSQLIFFSAPTTGGKISLTAKGGTGLPVAGQVAISASAEITDNAAAALAAVSALATTVASLKTLITTLTNLVLKIQKKVKA